MSSYKAWKVCITHPKRERSEVRHGTSYRTRTTASKFVTLSDQSNWGDKLQDQMWEKKGGRRASDSKQVEHFRMETRHIKRIRKDGFGLKALR